MGDRGGDFPTQNDYGTSGSKPNNEVNEKTQNNTDVEDPKTSLLNSNGQHQEKKSPAAALLPQLPPVLVISFGCFIHGTGVVYGIYATTGLQLESTSIKPNSSNNETVLGFPYDPVTDQSWIMGIASIGMIIGSVLAAPLSDRVGRKMGCILGIGVTYIISYVLFVFPVNMGLLYISRLMMGVGLGVSQSISTIYIAEISTPETRGSLAVIPSMTGCLGVNACQILGKYLNYRILALVFALFNIPFLILLLLIPESPVYYVSRGKMEEAKKQLRRLRGNSWDVVKECLEIKKTIEGVEHEGDKPKKSSLVKEFFQPHTIQSLIIAICLMFFFQMSGINLMLGYAPAIFSEVTNIDNFTANILLGLALFGSNTLTLVIAGKCPRRIMLLISSLGCSLTLAVMGVSYQIRDWEDDCRKQDGSGSGLENLSMIVRDDMDDLDTSLSTLCSYNVDWLPVLNSMIFIFVFNIGYGSMIWMTVVEILPASIRTFTNGLAVGWVGVLSFITLFTFPYLMEAVSGQIAFWIYSSVSFVGFLFIAIFVPETRGKTEDEIKLYFTSRKKETQEADKSKPHA